MDVFIFLSNFLFRIRYKLLFGTALAVLLAIFFSSRLPKLYNVSTTIFTGITSKASVDDMSGRSDWNVVNNSHENIIHIVKSKSTLEAVAIKLIAQHLMYGDREKDNKYIMASHYQSLLRIVPSHVLELVDKKSFENTVTNLTNFRKDERGNFIYDVFNWDNKYYGHLSLNKISVVRRGSSDMIEISYQCDDPGIAASTVAFLSEELSKRYETLLLSSSTDVVKYFEEQLSLAKKRLEMSEDELVKFNIDHRIINYEEQTKHLAALNNIIETRYEEVQLMYNSSQALVKELEVQMETRTKLVFENELFIKYLEKVSSLNGKIAEIEIFDSNNPDNTILTAYKNELAKAEEGIRNITDRMELYKTSKEGVAIPDMVAQWLDALLKYEKSKAELKVMDQRRSEIDKQYDVYSPVGPNLGKQTRNVKVEEEAYLTILHHLGLAKLKQKNILLDAGTLQVVTPPTIPLLVIPRKRELFVITAFFGALLFITGFYLIIELVDRTLRDGFRTERLTSGKVIGAFPAGTTIRHRFLHDETCKISIAHLSSILNGYIEPGKPFIVNLLSIEPKEGKTFIAENLQQHWMDSGFKAVCVSYEKEIEDSKPFLRAGSLFDLPSTAEKIEQADIIIAEYAPLNRNSIPKPLLAEAQVNLLIADAQRTWLPSDKATFETLLGSTKNIFIYLNNANREAVEQYTGQLPPYSPLRNLIYRLRNFGLTAQS